MTHRLYGTLDSLIDSEQRPLRPIGMSVQEAATRTADLLFRLSDRPGVRLFAGVRVAAGGLPIAFAVSAGRRLLLVEAVAWPVGRYSTTPQGGVLCDGTDIGQSVRPLLGSVRRLRRVLHRYQIAAAVVVHPSGPGTPMLPPLGSPSLSWLQPCEVGDHVTRRLRLGTPRRTFCHSDTLSARQRES